MSSGRLAIFEGGWLAVVGIACAVLSASGILHLWLRSGYPRWWRLFWAVVLLVPLFGPLLYATLFDPPTVQPEELRSHGRSGRPRHGRVFLVLLHGLTRGFGRRRRG
jgi:hypothetical protein